MAINIYKFLLLIVGLAFCVFGCDSERDNFLLPDDVLSENGESPAMESIVSGRMPPDGPPLTAVQIQLFRDWINQQDAADFPNLRHDDDDDDDDHDGDDDDDDDDDDDHDDDDDDD